MNTRIDELKSAFEANFDRGPVGVVQAPGRVNLIGEHTDYNDGFVLPIAIERLTLAAWAPAPGQTVRFRSLQQPDDPAELDLAGDIQPGQPKWANYCKGVAAGLRAHGIALAGCDILFVSDVPIGGGLSSSASLEVATGLALMAAAASATPDQAGSKLTPRELALICQKAEHDFAGAPCGIMDQSISIMGEQGRALLLDCRDGQSRLIPFDDPNLVLLVADTEVKHAIGDGGYAARRDQCYAAAAKLGVPMLRDVDSERVEQAAGEGLLSGKELMRARHVVGEITRTCQAVEALEAGEYDKFGQLMYGSHESLRDDYEVSCEELDAIVELARTAPGVHGARMTGGGFGGCAIVLADAKQADAITETIAAGFEKQFGRRCPIFATRAAQGASVVE